MPTKTLLETCEQLLDTKQHLLLVADTKRVYGIITMEDIFETLLGHEIVDEFDIAVEM